jgi:hypothetical protein
VAFSFIVVVVELVCIHINCTVIYLVKNKPHKSCNDSAFILVLGVDANSEHELFAFDFFNQKHTAHVQSASV